MSDNSCTFSGYEYYQEHNDEDAPDLDSIIEELDGYVSAQGKQYSSKNIKERINWTEQNVQHIETTINKYRISGEKRTAVYTLKRQKLHKKIIQELVIDKIKKEIQQMKIHAF